ncbi:MULTISPECIES: PDZ domain-containing protein [unclassified Streptomyces]|uniref:PDZ domain-containing protein n=1 Tax=unclassified Streptomyces TaxID=2593676 RepID=UPI0011A04358|nr:PDZ domain-containing protein [Streptomyces sp. BK340]TVZ80057.1 PDZ domain-containing protein [Streptomyces sp. BK340]
MDQTALRPKPMPGQERRGTGTPGPVRHPHAARRRGRRLRTLLFGLCTGTVLVLCGVGIGTVGATVIGMSRLAELQGQAPPHHPSAAPSPSPSEARTGATLGVEAVDADKAGALVVGVHVPGPGYTAGLVRGDVLLQFGRARVDTAADLARVVAHVRPGTEVTLTVRHPSGGYQQLTVVPGVVT